MFKIGFQAGGVNGVDQPSALQGAYRTCIVRAPILDTDANSSASRNDIATRARNACISLPTGFGERALREARELLESTRVRSPTRSAPRGAPSNCLLAVPQSRWKRWTSQLRCADDCGNALPSPRESVYFRGNTPCAFRIPSARFSTIRASGPGRTPSTGTLRSEQPAPYRCSPR